MTYDGQLRRQVHRCTHIAFTHPREPRGKLTAGARKRAEYLTRPIAVAADGYLTELNFARHR